MNPTVLEPVQLAHKDSINDQIWNRITARIRKDYEFQAHFGELDEEEQVQWSERIMNETLGFLKLCSLGVGSLGPSGLVDIGWHTFMLYSRDYMSFCDEVNGGYIHHEPTDDPSMVYDDQTDISTIDAMVHHGIEVDTELWTFGFGGECTAACRPAFVRCHSHCRNGGNHRE